MNNNNNTSLSQPTTDSYVPPVGTTAPAGSAPVSSQLPTSSAIPPISNDFNTPYSYSPEAAPAVGSSVDPSVISPSPYSADLNSYVADPMPASTSPSTTDSAPNGFGDSSLQTSQPPNVNTGFDNATSPAPNLFDDQINNNQSFAPNYSPTMPQEDMLPNSYEPGANFQDDNDFMMNNNNQSYSPYDFNNSANAADASMYSPSPYDPNTANSNDNNNQKGFFNGFFPSFNWSSSSSTNETNNTDLNGNSSVAPSTGNTILSLSMAGVDPWKAVFYGLVIFLLISYIFRIDWNYMIDWMFTYFTILFKTIYNSIFTAKEETDKKKDKQKQKDDSSEKDSASNKDDIIVPDYEFPEPKSSSYFTPGTSYSSSPFTTAENTTTTPSNKKPKPAGSIGNTFCLVAETQKNQRACVLVDSAKDCMSKSLYPSKLDCLQNTNPLQQNSNSQEETDKKASQ